MATQAAARQPVSGPTSKIEDPAHRHHPGRADRRGAAGPQAREHHDRSVREEHVRRAVGRAAPQLAAVRDDRQRLRRALLRRDGRAHRGGQRDHLAVAAEADREDSEARRLLGVAARRARAREDHARGHDDPVPVRHAAAAAAAAAAARVGARVGADGRRLVLHHHRRALVPVPPDAGHLPAQRRLAAQARHRGGPRSLRADGGEEGREEAGREEGRGRRRPTSDKKEARRRRATSPRRKPKKELTDEEKAKLAEAKAKADAERRARLAEQVKSTGLLKLLGAKADGDGSIADVLGKGDVDRDQEKAFQGVGGVGVASGNDSLRGIKSGGTRLRPRRRRRRPARRRQHRGRRAPARAPASAP